MAIPETVEFPLVASDPVPSQAIVKLQEAFAGDLHPSRSIVLGPAKWQPQTAAIGRGNGGSTAVLGNNEWGWGGGPTRLACDLEVPVGHEVTSIRWYYTRGGASSITRGVRSRLLSTGAAEAVVIADVADGAGAAWAGATDAVSIVSADNTSYTLEVSMGDAAHRFAGAKVTYRKLP